MALAGQGAVMGRESRCCHLRLCSRGKNLGSAFSADFLVIPATSGHELELRYHPTRVLAQKGAREAKARDFNELNFEDREHAECHELPQERSRNDTIHTQRKLRDSERG